MTDDDALLGLLRGVGAVGIGAGALALFPSLAVTVPLTNVFVPPCGVVVIHQLGDHDSFGVEDATTFSMRNSAHYEALVWLPEHGDGPDGGDDRVWYGSLVGAYSAAWCGQQQTALVVEEAAESRTLRGTGPHGATKVLIRLDETPRPDAPRAITWWHDRGAGQARYTSLDRVGSYHDTMFTRLRLPDLRVAVRAVRDDVEQVLLTDGGERWLT